MGVFMGAGWAVWRSVAPDCGTCKPEHGTIMNARERLLTAAHGGMPDRVPVAPYMGNHAARVAGIRIGDYCRSGELMAKAQFHAWQIYGQDAVVAQSDNYYIAEGFGVEVEHHEDSTPTLKTPAIRSLQEIERLRVPEPTTDGRMPVYLDAIRRLAAVTRGAVAVRAPGTGPFSLAGHLMGAECFLLELALADRKPGGPAEQALRHLLDLTTEALIRFAKACLEAGADVVQAGDSLASIEMISPGMYRKWAWPAERAFFRAIRPIADGRGAACLLHICGDMTPVLEDMAASGAHILELDHKVGLREARQRLGPGICLMGNLDPVECLWRGSAADAGDAARKAMADAGQRAFILGSGCEVPVAAPPENLHAMIAAAQS